MSVAGPLLSPYNYVYMCVMYVSVHVGMHVCLSVHEA